MEITENNFINLNSSMGINSVIFYFKTITDDKDSYLFCFCFFLFFLFVVFAFVSQNDDVDAVHVSGRFERLNFWYPQMVR